MGAIFRRRKCYTGKVRDKSQYSTDEQFTGEYWIDGKPLYRRVYSATGTFTGNITLDANINCSTLTMCRMSEVYKISTGAYIGRTDYYANNARGYTLLTLNTSRLEIQSNVSITGYTVVVEYTKTTD